MQACFTMETSSEISQNGIASSTEMHFTSSVGVFVAMGVADDDGDPRVEGEAKSVAVVTTGVVGLFGSTFSSRFSSSNGGGGIGASIVGEGGVSMATILSLGSSAA